MSEDPAGRRSLLNDRRAAKKRLAAATNGWLAGSKVGFDRRRLGQAAAKLTRSARPEAIPVLGAARQRGEREQRCSREAGAEYEGSRSGRSRRAGAQAQVKAASVAQFRAGSVARRQQVQACWGIAKENSTGKQAGFSGSDSGGPRRNGESGRQREPKARERQRRTQCSLNAQAAEATLRRV